MARRGVHGDTTAMEANQTIEPDLAPGDIASLVNALLDGIDRGELSASPKEIDFLRSVAEILPATNGGPAAHSPR